MEGQGLPVLASRNTNGKVSFTKKDNDTHK